MVTVAVDWPSLHRVACFSSIVAICMVEEEGDHTELEQ